MKPMLAATAILLAACAATPAPAPGPETGPAVVPAPERERAPARNSAGPTANRGIESVKVLGTVPLANEIEGAGTLVLRARELVVAPGGVVAVHEHHRRPGVAYILEGEMTEFRVDQAPAVHGAGSTAFEQSGVTHWWENHSGKRVRALVVDIVPEGT